MCLLCHYSYYILLTLGREQVKRSSLQMADSQAYYGQNLSLKMGDREAYGQVFENPGAAGTCMGSSEVKHGSSSEVDPTELTSTTTFY